MIRIATAQLTIADDNGTPVHLDIGTLEKNLNAAFRKLGYQDVWMAEDISLTITERIQESDATLLSRQQIESMVHTILNALGYADVAQEYAALAGKSPVAEAKGEMRTWTQEEIAQFLERSLPMTRLQLDKIALLCYQSLQSLHLNIASPKLILELATHTLANENTPKEHAPVPFWKLEGVSNSSFELITGGLLRPLPPSLIIPKARLAIQFTLFTQQFPDWWMPLSMPSALQSLQRPIIELLQSMQKELATNHPLLADSAPQLILQDCMQALNNDPRLWKKKDRQDTLNLLQTTLKDMLAGDLPANVNVFVK